MILNTDGALAWSSPAAQRYGLLAHSHAPRTLLSYVHKEDLSRFEAAVTHALREPGCPANVISFRVLVPDGSVRHFDATLTHLPETQEIGGTLVSLHDVSERRKLDTEQAQLEKQASRAQRLESIGTLAGGIAHDLNNALTPILMMIDFLKDEYPEESEALETVERSANHAAEMVRQLLAFAKGNEGRRVSLPPRRLIKDIEKIAKSTFPKNIRVQLRLPSELPDVLGDATQLHQVLLNLCVNARDAMPEGGTLTLEATTAPSDDSVQGGATESERARNGYVVLRITDTGTGMPPELVEKIFDPFFTTKGPEKGTGLGLFTAAGIVKGHDGFVRVYSRPGEGSTFAIFLPAVTAVAGPEVVREPEPNFSGNGAHVLYVDDENDVRIAARTVLAQLNFTPLIAKDAMGGLLQAMQHRSQLQAVITDLHMPNMDGLAFIRSLRRALPDVPVIVASGRLEAAPIKDLQRVGVTVLLDKPFTREMLAKALRTVLATPQPQSRPALESF